MIKFVTMMIICITYYCLYTMHVYFFKLTSIHFMYSSCYSWNLFWRNAEDHFVKFGCHSLPTMNNNGEDVTDDVEMYKCYQDDSINMMNDYDYSTNYNNDNNDNNNDVEDPADGNVAYDENDVNHAVDDHHDTNADNDEGEAEFDEEYYLCLLYTSPSPRDRTRSRMPSSA